MCACPRDKCEWKESLALFDLNCPPYRTKRWVGPARPSFFLHDNDLVFRHHLHYSPTKVHIDFIHFSQWPRVTDPNPRPRSCRVCQTVSRPFDKSKMTRGRDRWPRDFGKLGWFSCAKHLEKSVVYSSSIPTQAIEAVYSLAMRIQVYFIGCYSWSCCKRSWVRDGNPVTIRQLHLHWSFTKTPGEFTLKVVCPHTKRPKDFE